MSVIIILEFSSVEEPNNAKIFITSHTSAPAPIIKIYKFFIFLLYFFHQYKNYQNDNYYNYGKSQNYYKENNNVQYKEFN